MNTPIKKMSASALLLVAGMISLATPSLRADDNKGPDGYHRMHDRGEGHGDWQEKLGLSDDQSKKMTTIKTTEKAEMEPLHQKMKVLRKKLAWQVEAKAGDKELKATLDDLSASFAAVQSAEKKYRDQKAAILTPTQQAQAVLAMTGHFDRMEHTDRGAHGHDAAMRKDYDEPKDKNE